MRSVERYLIYVLPIPIPGGVTPVEVVVCDLNEYADMLGAELVCVNQCLAIGTCVCDK